MDCFRFVIIMNRMYEKRENRKETKDWRIKWTTATEKCEKEGDYKENE